MPKKKETYYNKHSFCVTKFCPDPKNSKMVHVTYDGYLNMGEWFQYLYKFDNGYQFVLPDMLANDDGKTFCAFCIKKKGRCYFVFEKLFAEVKTFKPRNQRGKIKDNLISKVYIGHEIPSVIYDSLENKLEIKKEVHVIADPPSPEQDQKSTIEHLEP